MKISDALMEQFWESDWFKSRPPAIQQLAREFPPGTQFGEYWVIGWTEGENGKASGLKLAKDGMTYEEACANSMYVCMNCIRAGKLDCED